MQLTSMASPAARRKRRWINVIGEITGIRPVSGDANLLTRIPSVWPARKRQDSKDICSIALQTRVSVLKVGTGPRPELRLPSQTLIGTKDHHKCKYCAAVKYFTPEIMHSYNRNKRIWIFHLNNIFFKLLNIVKELQHSLANLVQRWLKNILIFEIRCFY